MKFEDIKIFIFIVLFLKIETPTEQTPTGISIKQSLPKYCYLCP